jgi:hypothetical protein
VRNKRNNSEEEVESKLGCSIELSMVSHPGNTFNYISGPFLGLKGERSNNLSTGSQVIGKFYLITMYTIPSLQVCTYRIPTESCVIPSKAALWQETRDT